MHVRDDSIRYNQKDEIVLAILKFFSNGNCVVDHLQQRINMNKNLLLLITSCDYSLERNSLVHTMLLRSIDSDNDEGFHQHSNNTDGLGYCSTERKIYNLNYVKSRLLRFATAKQLVPRGIESSRARAVVALHQIQMPEIVETNRNVG